MILPDFDTCSSSKTFTGIICSISKGMDWCKTMWEVICAHCTCMAGAEEACSHIGALLFTTEANTMTKRQHSCRSLLCSWLLPSHQFVSATKIIDIDFKTPKSKQHKKSSIHQSLWLQMQICQYHLIKSTVSWHHLHLNKSISFM